MIVKAQLYVDPDTIDNPYLDEYLRVQEEFCGAGSSADVEWVGAVISEREWRWKLISKYGWSIPDINALELAAAHGPIVEVGAGSGYWANLLSKMGVDVVAYDIAVGNSNAVTLAEQTWFDVCYGGADVAAKHSDRTLMLCWPPYASDMAATTLAAYTGNKVIYVGEPRGGCVADTGFFELLEQHFRVVETVELPSWWPVRDTLSVWVRTGSH